MKSSNIPEVKLGIIAVSRDCFPIALSEKRRAAISAACAAKGTDLYECKTTVENEHDMQKAVAEVTAAGCNALTVFLGNFGPETPETLIAKYFDGPCMFVAAAEGDGDMINGRGDAYCGMLNCSYNLGMRHLKGYIPEYPVGTAEEIADKIAEFVPIARTILGVCDLKIITFGPRPQDFFACNAPIKGLYELGVEIEENSELDLLVSYKEHAGDPRIADVCADMAAEMGEGHYYPDLLTRMAQFELTLLDWAENHKGSESMLLLPISAGPLSRRSSGLSLATSTPALPAAASPWPARSIFTVPCPSTSACVRPATPSPCWTSTTACPSTFMMRTSPASSITS